MERDVKEREEQMRAAKGATEAQDQYCTPLREKSQRVKLQLDGLQTELRDLEEQQGPLREHPRGPGDDDVSEEPPGGPAGQKLGHNLQAKINFLLQKIFFWILLIFDD